jgi:hypothetical protein
MAQPASPAAAPTPLSGPAGSATPSHFELDGFRSAHWGMTAAQIRVAVGRDFNIPADKIRAEPDEAEHTTALTITVPELIGAGPARVSYIVGYKSRTLIQVNILWGTQVDPRIAPDKIVAAANQLRQLFLGSGYEPASIVTNARMKDGSVVVFEGQDSKKHATVLRLASMSQPAKPGAKPTVGVALLLSYILDSSNPDIFRLKKGEF